MIVPRNRLLLWVALIVLPFAYLGTIESRASLVAVVAIALLAGLAILDAIMARTRLRGITVQLPTIARVSKDRETGLEVRIRNESQKSLRVGMALALPREIESNQERLDIELPSACEWSRLVWKCRPRKRGHYQLTTTSLETPSPLGFWSARKLTLARTSIRVYPNLFLERRNLAALFLRRGTFGLHAHRQVGKGREFEKLREYVPGDSFEEIHWKATARRGRPITKVFQIERTQQLYVVLDASRLSGRPAVKVPAMNREGADSGTTETMLERFITAGLLLGRAAEQQGDLFGILTFSNKVENFVRARNGKVHYNACRDALYTLQHQLVSPDYDEVCSFIRLRLRHRALLVFLTALDDAVLAESFVRNLDLIRRQHLILVNMIQPPGVGPLFSDPNVSTVDHLYQHLGGHFLWANLRELEKVLQRRGVRFSLVNNERLSPELVSQYLNVKRRQVL